MNEISNFFLIIVYADFIILFKVKSSFQSSAKTQIPPHSLHRKHLNDLSIMDALCIESSLLLSMALSRCSPNPSSRSLLYQKSAATLIDIVLRVLMMRFYFNSSR